MMSSFHEVDWGFGLPVYSTLVHFGYMYMYNQKQKHDSIRYRIQKFSQPSNFCQEKSHKKYTREFLF